MVLLCGLFPKEMDKVLKGAGDGYDIAAALFQILQVGNLTKQILKKELI